MQIQVSCLVTDRATGWLRELFEYVVEVISPDIERVELIIAESFREAMSEIESREKLQSEDDLLDSFLLRCRLIVPSKYSEENNIQDSHQELWQSLVQSGHSSRGKRREAAVCYRPSIVFLVRAFGVGASLAEPTIRHVSSSGNVWGFFIEVGKISSGRVNHFN